MKIKHVFQIAVCALLVLTIAQWGYAAEHPAEHPKEHSEMMMEKVEISKEKLAEAIKEYVEKDAKLKGGYFVVYDEKAGKPLALSLVKVHEDRLSTIGDGVYFACADFATPEGKVYDLDIFMKAKDKDEYKHGLKVKDISVHKEAGVERYTWYEEDGVWKKHYMEGSHPKGSSMKQEGSSMKHEHPSEGSSMKHEHPE